MPTHYIMPLMDLGSPPPTKCGNVENVEIYQLFLPFHPQYGNFHFFFTLNPSSKDSIFQSYYLPCQTRNTFNSSGEFAELSLSERISPHVGVEIV